MADTDEVVLAELTIRTQILEREVNELKRHNEQHGANDMKRWDDLLVRFGELKAKVEGLNGRVAGYLIAGMLLAVVVSFLAQFLFASHR